MEEVIETPEEITINLLDIVPLKGKLDDLPKVKGTPHYVFSKEGLYLRSENLLGEYLLKQKTIPTFLETIGENKGGLFTFTAPALPQQIMGQALDFFSRVYTNDKTEAEVLILFKPDTKEYKLFVPWQYCTGASVESIYDPADIDDEWVVVGTIHSHCDFGAFHSGTDTADASTFNGLHITIGHVNHKEPSYAAMIMVNEVQFEFKTISDVASIVKPEDNDFVAPAEWDNFLLDKINEVYDKEFKTLTKPQLDEFVKSVSTPWVGTNRNTSIVALGSGYDDWDDGWWKSDNKSNERRGWNKWQERSGNWTPKRWSTDFKEMLPSEWFEKDGRIKDEHVGDLLTDRLEEIFAIAREYDIFLEYKMFDHSELNAMEDIRPIKHPNPNKDDEEDGDKDAFLLTDEEWEQILKSRGLEEEEFEEKSLPNQEQSAVDPLVADNPDLEVRIRKVSGNTKPVVKDSPIKTYFSENPVNEYAGKEGYDHAIERLLDGEG